MSWSPWIWMYLNEQFPMVCLGCLENKYFSRHLMFGLGKNATEPSCIRVYARSDTDTVRVYMLNDF